MHSVKSKLSLLPILMLAFLDHDSLMLFKIVSRCRYIHVSPAFKTFADINNIDRLATC